MAPLSITRRQLGATLIGAATLAATAGCNTTEPQPVDTNRLLLEEAELAELNLLAQIQGSIETLPRPAAEVSRLAVTSVQMHISRLAATLGSTSSPSPSPSDPISDSLAPQQLAELARQVSVQHRESLTRADPPTAQLLASIAASDLVIAVALSSAS